MFRFANIEYLWALLLIPALVIAHVLYTRHKRRQLSSIGDADLVEALMPNASRIRPHVKFSLLMLALTLLIFAAARPQYGTKEETIKRQGIEMMVALDISNSMLAEDIAPSRLEKAKQMLTSMINRFQNDKVGLVVFAGNAFTQLPITCDYVSAKTFLQNIDPSLIPAQGTAIGKAIETSMQSFGADESEASRVIILITDGENHEDDAVGAAKQAREKGVKVLVVGIGKPEGSPIPVSAGSNNYLKDRQGQVVVSRLNEAMCRQIAEAGGGIYVRADNTNSAVKILEKEIDKLAKTELESKVFTAYNEQYQSFVLVALLILVIDFFIFARKNKRLSRINLYNIRDNFLTSDTKK